MEISKAMKRDWLATARMAAFIFFRGSRRLRSFFLVTLPRILKCASASTMAEIRVPSDASSTGRSE